MADTSYRTREEQIQTLAPLLAAIGEDKDGDVILPFLEWCALAGLPESTAREMRARGEGPRCIKYTKKKLGVTLAEHRRWTKARMEIAAA
jgi:hypothetical protein